MKTGKMPPGLAKYWKTHARKRRVKTAIGVRRFRARARRVDAGHHTAHRSHCTHGNARKVVSNVRGVLWCGDCGALCDGHRWHRPHR
jgi:hypothetical protein